jgi:hypothetical protein
MELGSLMQICHQRLPSLHFKKAITLWKCGALHETIKMTTAALDFYSTATETFEKLIHNQNDTRTKQALNYLLSQKYACDDTNNSCLWLITQPQQTKQSITRTTNYLFIIHMKNVLNH